MSIQETTAVGFDLPEVNWRHRMVIARQHRGLKVSELARYVGFDENTIGNWTSGRTTPRTDDLIKYCAACRVTMEWLYGDPAMARYTPAIEAWMQIFDQHRDTFDQPISGIGCIGRFPVQPWLNVSLLGMN